MRMCKDLFVIKTGLFATIPRIHKNANARQKKSTHMQPQVSCFVLRFAERKPQLFVFFFQII